MRLRLVGTAAMAVVFLASAVRLNDAKITQATAVAPGERLRLDYSRLDRRGGSTRLRLWVAPAPAQDRLRIRLNTGYAKLIRIERILPVPDRVETGLNDIIFVFNRSDPDSAMVITFDVRPVDFGRLDGRLAIVGERALEFTQFSIP